MRISRIDPDDPEGKRRRHYEISIDSPFTVLNCRATQANTALPQYSGPAVHTGHRQHTSCGCPDAEVLTTQPSAASSTASLPLVDGDATSDQAMPTVPQAAHVHRVSAGASGTSRPGTSNVVTSANPLQRVRDQEAFENPRPIHLLRVPSYDPPAFDADSPPPPPPEDDLMSPPPNYDAGVDGLADYFARLANYEEPGTEAGDDSDSGEEHTPTRIMSRTGRVNIANPRTPGGRLVPSRSLDIERPPVVSLRMPTPRRRDEADS